MRPHACQIDQVRMHMSRHVTLVPPHGNERHMHIHETDRSEMRAVLLGRELTSWRRDIRDQLAISLELLHELKGKI
jgi:hypothetical protein